VADVLFWPLFVCLFVCLQVCLYVANGMTTSSSAIAEGPRDSLSQSVEILSAAAQLYEKSHLTRRIALSCGIKISPVGSLD